MRSWEEKSYTQERFKDKNLTNVLKYRHVLRCGRSGIIDY